MTAAAKPKGKWVKPPVRSAGPRKRHWALVISFILMVVVPLAIAYHLLWNRTADQYASNVGFSVHSEDQPSAIELLGGITSIAGGSSGSDSDILYELIQSQQMVRRVDEALDLEKIYTAASENPLLALPENPSIEDLTQHWKRKVHIYHDNSTGLIEMRILAFSPEAAQAIASKVMEVASTKINELSDIARDDAMENARDILRGGENRLRESRQALVEFRNANNIVDPTLESQSQFGVLNSLQQQLSETYVELDLISSVARKDDIRIQQAKLKIDVIKERIKEERAKVSTTNNDDGRSLSTIIAEYEGLAVELEFAQQSYLAAQSNLDASLARAQRQSRYLAVHIGPTIAEASEYPKRWTKLGLSGLFLFLFWSFIILVYFSVRDRR